MPFYELEHVPPTLSIPPPLMKRARVETVSSSSEACEEARAFAQQVMNIVEHSERLETTECAEARAFAQQVMTVLGQDFVKVCGNASATVIAALENSKNKLVEVDGELSKMKQENETLAEENRRLKQSIESLNQGIESLRREQLHLKQQSTSEIEMLSETIRRAMEVVQTLSDQEDDYMKILRTSEEAKKTLTNEIEKLEKSNADLSEKLRAFQEEAKKTLADESEENNVALVGKLRAFREDMETATNEIEKLEEKLQASEEEIEDLTNEIEELEEKLQASEEAKKTLANEVEDLEESNADLGEKLLALMRRERARDEKDIQEDIQESQLLVDLNSHIHDLETRLRAADEKIATLEPLGTVPGRESCESCDLCGLMNKSRPQMKNAEVDASIPSMNPRAWSTARVCKTLIDMGHDEGAKAFALRHVTREDLEPHIPKAIAPFICLGTTEDMVRFLFDVVLKNQD